MRKLTREEKFMREALKCAKRGLEQGEVPIGAVIVYQDKVVARGYNRRAKLQLASAHAEMMALDKACKKFGSREWQPTPVLWPGESHGQRSLAGPSVWGHKESDT